ncbi:MAG TPA: hypothetical protein VK652_01065 [Steroidobacteraceae bacterium]|nr:hypothetical protein [Steroidobacteraceae bacterium]
MTFKTTQNYVNSQIAELCPSPRKRVFSCPESLNGTLCVALSSRLEGRDLLDTQSEAFIEIYGAPTMKTKPAATDKKGGAKPAMPPAGGKKGGGKSKSGC